MKGLTMVASAARRSPELPETDGAGQMSFLDHLEDLRRRLVLACVGLLVGTIGAVAFVQRIFDFVFVPINAQLPPDSHFIYTRPGEALSIYIQIALISGAVVAAPWILYQVWLFIAPGLYQREKRFAIPFVLLTSVGCVAGALFSHYFAFPSMMAFFAGFDRPTVRFLPSVEPVFDLYIRLLLAMVVVFQMPTVAFFLARMGVVTAGFLVHKFKYAVLIIFVIAAVVTPSSDPWNQSILAGTMLILYLLCIGIVALFGQRPKDVDAVGILICASASLWHRRGKVLPFEQQRHER
jgi:sec-independent protein translocase protein TatC